MRTRDFPQRMLMGVFLCSGLLTGCLTNSPSPKKTPLWDTTFSIGSVSFPNDTIFNRATPTITPNGRVTRFLEKCESRDTVRIGFIGGSITAGATTTDPSLRYSSLLASFIKRGYPRLKSIVEINAGIGSTGSRYGASRAAADLLSQNPDLIVIEYAVNDFGVGSNDYIRATMEGLIRQSLEYSPDVPVILLSTAKGDGQNVQALHAQVGAHYNLPMISYRDAIWPLIDSNRITWNDVFHDDPHPNDKGHRLAAHLLYTYLKKARDLPGTGGATVPAALATDLYEHAGVVVIGDTSVQAELKGWQAFDGGQNRAAYKTQGTGPDTLTLRTSMRELTLGIHMHASDTSSVRLRLEGGGLDTTLNDFYPFEHTRLVQVFVSDTAKPRALRIAHSGGASFRIDYVLYAK